MPSCANDLKLSNYIIYAPTTPSNLRVPWPWLLIWYLLLDLGHARPGQDLHMTHASPLGSGSHRKSTRPRVFNTSIPLRSMYVTYAPSPPVHIQCCLPMVINWMPPTGLIWFQIQPGPTHGPWSLQWAEGTGKHRMLWDSLLYLYLSYGLLNRISSQICCSCYFPMFLFRDVSFILMFIVSFMFLVIFCDYLPTMLKLSILVGWSVMYLLHNLGGWVMCQMALKLFIFLLLLLYSCTK